MPATAAELGVTDPDDPEENLRGGITYLRHVYATLPDTVTEQDRILWSLAGYNCGPAFVRAALTHASEDNGYPASSWIWNRVYLFHHRIGVHEGQRVVYPDYRAVWRYVDLILEYFRVGYESA
jgi:membrane-bound lytic murein transglycosylase MltF